MKHRVQSDLEDAHFTDTVRAFKTSAGHLFQAGAGAPSATLTGVGNAPGGLYIDTTNKSLYANEGTKASATWTQIAAGGDIDLADNVSIKFGTDDDAVMTWDGSNLTILPLTDNVGAFNIGDGTTDMDFKWFGASTAAYCELNVGDVAANFVALPVTLSGTTATALTLSGVNATSGILFSGTIDRCLDFGTLTVGTTTDGVLMRAGTGIGASGLAFGTASMRAFALYLRYTATSGTFKGMRLRCIADPSSGAASMDNFHCQTSVIASKNATTLNGGFFEIIPKGTNVIDFARCILTNVDSAAAVTFTTGLVNMHIRTHTRGDETMSGVDEMLRIENEAVGGNGRQMDSWISIKTTTLSGGIKGAAYLIDAGTATDVCGTALFRFGDDGVVASDASEISATSAGWLKIVVGTSTRYINLYSGSPS